MAAPYAQHKVLWQEGMFLSPQHFQQADRFHQGQLAQVLHAVAGFAYGIQHLDVDRQALAAGDLGLLAGDGVFPDGTPFRFSDPNELPPARPIAEHLGPNDSRIAVYLALPSTPPGAVACSPDGRHDGRLTRFQTRSATVIDDTQGGRERQIPLAAPNLRVLFGDEPRDGHPRQAVIPIDQLGDGVVMLQGYGIRFLTDAEAKRERAGTPTEQPKEEPKPEQQSSAGGEPESSANGKPAKTNNSDLTPDDDKGTRK